MQVKFENGRTAEAVLLAGNRHEMRVVVEGFGDTQRWEKVDGVWLNERGEPMQIEALLAVDGTDWLAFCAEVGSATMAMGISYN
jgi:hypothetical protein